MKLINLLKAYAPACMAILITCIILIIFTDEQVHKSSYADDWTEFENMVDTEIKSDVSLKIDYRFLAGQKIRFEVYAENPVSENGQLKENITPFFKASTDEYSRFDGKIDLPADLRKVYVYTPVRGLPQCMELNVADNKIDSDTSPPLEEKRNKLQSDSHQVFRQE